MSPLHTQDSRVRAGLSALIVSFGALMLALPAAAQQMPPPSVTVMAAKSGDFTLTSRLPGRLKASTVAEDRPQVSGIIRERLFEEGARVEVGQPLYKIEDETYVAAVAAAKASVQQAEANYALAVIDARRAEQLYATKTGSEANRDTANATRDANAAAVQMAKAELSSAEIELDRTTIRAPISGVIGLSQTTTGALVAAQQTTALATIRTLDPIYVDVTQSANDLLQWSASQESRDLIAVSTAEMTLPDRSIYQFKGELKAAEPQVEPTTGMVTLRISFRNPDYRLLPGLYVEVELPQSLQKDAILVPQNAVMRDATGSAHAWVIEDGKIAVRPVKILTTSESNWVIIDGLKPGDQIVTSGFQKAAPGAEVQIVTEGAAPAGAPGAPGAPAAAEGH